MLNKSGSFQMRQDYRQVLNTCLHFLICFVFASNFIMTDVYYLYQWIEFSVIFPHMYKSYSSYIHLLFLCSLPPPVSYFIFYFLLEDRCWDSILLCNTHWPNSQSSYLCFPHTGRMGMHCWTHFCKSYKQQEYMQPMWVCKATPMGTKSPMYFILLNQRKSLEPKAHITIGALLRSQKSKWHSKSGGMRLPLDVFPSFSPFFSDPCAFAAQRELCSMSFCPNHDYRELCSMSFCPNDDYIHF